VVLKFLSVKSIVIAPANTGKVITRRKAVKNNDQINKGKRYKVKPLTRIFIIVVIKLIAPAIEDTPDKCKLKIAKSTEPPECEVILERGG
jgi:hypothetical protein